MCIRDSINALCSYEWYRGTGQVEDIDHAFSLADSLDSIIPVSYTHLN